MKWSIQQLNKLVGKSIDFDYLYDFNENIKSLSDVLSISKTKVTGSCNIPQMNLFEFKLLIETTMTIECARTLEPVDFPMSIDINQVFSVNGENEDHILIESNSVDLIDFVWETVLLNKPLRVLKYSDNE